MTKQVINVGAEANDKQGDSLRAAFQKVNSNFTELYTALGLNADTTLNLGNFKFTNNTITLIDPATDGSTLSTVTIDQPVSVGSNLTVSGDLLPNVANGGDLGSSSQPWRSLYVSNSTIYLGGTPLAINQSGQLTINGSQVGGSVAWNNVTGKPTIPDGDRLINATDKIVLNEEGATRLSMYVNNVEKSRLQINTNDLLLSSLAGGVVLAATDGVGGEWRFKTNGNLESTGGNFLSAAETPAVFGSLNSTSTGASSGTVTLKSGTGAVDGGSIYIEAGTGGSGNDGEVAIRTGSGPYEWLFDNGGNLTLPRGSLKHDDALGFFTVEGPVTADMIDAGTPGVYQTISNGVEIVTHRPGDDLERKFRFAWDGALYMPTDTSNGQVGALEWRINNGNTTSQVRSTPGGGIFPPGLALVSYGENPGISFNVAFNKNWIFDQYGNTRIPGDIRSEGNINIDINLTDSTLRRWSFGEDGVLNLAGDLQFADGTVQTTAALTYTNFGDSGVRTDGGTGNNFWKPTFADGTGTINKAGVYKTANNANNSLFTFGANGAGTMSVVMDGSLFVGSSLPSNNGGLNTNYGGWLVVQAGAKFGGDLNTIGNFILDTPGNYVRFGDGTTQTTAADFGYLDLDKDTIKGTAGYQYTFATDGYFTGSTSSESTNYFFVAYNTTNANIAAGWTVVGGTANTTVSSVTYPVAGYPGVIRVNLTVAASSTAGFYPVTVTSPDRLRVEIQPNPGTSDKFAFTTSGLTLPNSTSFTGTSVTMPTTPSGTTNSFTWNFSDNVIGSDTITLNWNLLGTNQSSWYFAVNHNTTLDYLLLDGASKSLSYGQGGLESGKVIFGTAAGNNAGDVNAIELKANNGDVYVTSTESVKITVDAADSSARVWRFDPTGELSFPDGTSQTTAFAGNAATVDIMNTNGIDTNYYITFVENRSATQDLRADVDLYFNSWSNTLTAGNVTTGILKIEDGVHEKFQTKADATGVVAHDCTSGHIFYHTSPDANWTVNLTNLNLSSGYATAVTLIIVQGGTGYYPSAVQIGGVAQTLNWQGNATPTPSTNRTDVVTFSIINNSGTYTVLGQLTGF